MAETLTSKRLILRPWTLDDVDDAFRIYGQQDVSRWLSPAMDQVSDEHGMRLVLQQWISEDDRAVAPSGRWAVERSSDGHVVGGLVLLYLPPGGRDLEMGWQLAPDEWGNGYATEAGRALARWALQQDEVDEIFAVVRSQNARAAATARRIGMEWVGETDKYYDLHLQVYRLRMADLVDPPRF